MFGGQAFSSLTYNEAPPPLAPTGPQQAEATLPLYYISTAYVTKLNALLESQAGSIKYMVISGITGSGKTVLAHQYLKSYQSQHPEHFTAILQAETKTEWWQYLQEWAEGLYLGLYELLKDKQEEKKRKKLIERTIKAALSETPWCILVDNWDGGTPEDPLPIRQIKGMFNRGEGTLLITTQNKTSPFGAKASLSLSDGFSLKESYTLLEEVIKLSVDTSFLPRLGNTADKKALIKALNRLPLAIAVAGSYLGEENQERLDAGEAPFTYREYITLLEARVELFNARHRKRLSATAYLHETAIAAAADDPELLKTQEAAVDLSLEKAIQLNAPIPNTSLWQFLCFCGFLASTHIPQQLMKEYLHQLLPQAAEEHINEAWKTQQKAAERYSLLQREDKCSVIDSKPSYRMHHVIQRVLRDVYWPKLVEREGGLVVNAATDPTIAAEARAALASEGAFLQSAQTLRKPMRKTLLIHFCLVVENADFDKVRAYLPHIIAWQERAGKTPSNNSDEVLDEAPLQAALAVYKEALGDVIGAKELLEQVLETQIRGYDNEQHEEVARTQMNLGGILLSLGQYDEAKTLLAKALKTQYESSKPDHLCMAATYKNLGIVLHELGQYGDAKEYYEQALCLYAAYGGEDYREVATTQLSYAGLLCTIGQLHDAKNLMEEALNRLIHHYGEEHVDVAMAKQNWANVLKLLGQHEEAKQLYEQALKTAIHHYRNESHVTIAKIRHNLAETFDNLGQYTEAEQCFQQALSAKIAWYGEQHLSTALTQTSLAATLCHLDRQDEAKIFLEKALKTQQYYYGKEHEEVAKTQRQLAMILTHLGQRIKAKNLLKQAQATQIKRYGDNHLEVAITTYNLILVTGSLGDLSLVSQLPKCEAIFSTQAGGEVYLAGCQEIMQRINSYLPQQKQMMRQEQTNERHTKNKRPSDKTQSSSNNTIKQPQHKKNKVDTSSPHESILIGEGETLKSTPVINQFLFEEAHKIMAKREATNVPANMPVQLTMSYSLTHSPRSNTFRLQEEAPPTIVPIIPDLLIELRKAADNCNDQNLTAQLLGSIEQIERYSKNPQSDSEQLNELIKQAKDLLHIIKQDPSLLGWGEEKASGRISDEMRHLKKF